MSEKYYDEVIALKLKEVMELCQANGLSIVAVVEYAPESVGRNFASPPGQPLSIGMKMVDWAAQCHGNVDKFMIAASNHARQHGHSSIYLKQAGVPLEPT